MISKHFEENKFFFIETFLLKESKSGHKKSILFPGNQFLSQGINSSQKNLLSLVMIALSSCGILWILPKISPKVTYFVGMHIYNSQLFSTKNQFLFAFVQEVNCHTIAYQIQTAAHVIACCTDHRTTSAMISSAIICSATLSSTTVWVTIC